MTKKQFISEATRLGFKNYKKLVAKLGYNERTLDRYKQDGELTGKFLKAFEQYKAGAKPVEKTDLKDVEIKKPTQKVENSLKRSTEAHIKVLEKIQNDGIGIDISNADYHSTDNIGVSKLKVMIDNAREFEAKYITKTVQQTVTDALIVGRLHHTFVLEPHTFEDEYIMIDLPSRPVKDDLVKALETLGGEVELRENSKNEMVVKDTVETLKEKIELIKEKLTKTVCTKAHYDLAKQTAEKALNSWFELKANGQTLLKAQLKDLLQTKKCYVEKTFYGEIDGVKVQIRPDILINLGAKDDVWFVIDLKTLEVATPQMFVRQGGTFFWDMQEAFYNNVLAQNDINVKAFYFNCAGKKEFSGAGFYEWGISSKDEAKKVVQAGINKYKYCVENNIFLETKFDFSKLEFEAITTLEVPIYRQYTLGDLGV